MLKHKKTNVPHSWLEALIPNTAIIIILTILDSISIYNFANDLMSELPPLVITSFAVTLAVLIDFGAIVLGYIAASRLRRQSLIRFSTISLIACILIGIGFLITMRVMSKDLIFDGGSSDIAKMFANAGVESDNSGLSKALKTVINVFLAVQIIGTAAISFALSALRANFTKLLVIEKLEKDVARMKSYLQYQVNLRDSGFRAITEEKRYEHKQMYDTVRAENQSMKEKIFSEFTLGTGIQWLTSNIIPVTPAPSVPYISDGGEILFSGSASSYDYTEPEAINASYPEFNESGEVKGVNVENSVSDDASYDSMNVHDQYYDEFYEEDI